MMHTRTPLVVAAFLIGNLPALAADLPQSLVPDLLQVEHEVCRTSTGYGTRFLTIRDVNGDGRADVVLDYSDAICGGVPNFFCKSGGCLLRVYIADKGGYRKVYDAPAGRWLVGEAPGHKAVLTVDGRPVGG